MSFKIGDKVKRVMDIDQEFYVSSGAVVTVSEVDGQWVQFEEDNSDFDWWKASFYELVEEPTQPKLRWLQVEYIKNTDHPMSGLNKHITAPVLQYWDGSDWQTIETVLETRHESV